MAQIDYLPLRQRAEHGWRLSQLGAKRCLRPQAADTYAPSCTTRLAAVCFRELVAPACGATFTKTATIVSKRPFSLIYSATLAMPGNRYRGFESILLHHPVRQFW